jgi:CheY-like chemotaxis protein
MEKAIVFLVDDDDDDRMLISQALLDLMDYLDIREINSGAALINLMTSSELERPALILLDMNMPGLDGLAVLASLKEDLDNRMIPVVMMSTSSDRELVSKAYKLGVNAFIKKPITAAEYELAAQAVNLCFLNYLHISQFPPVALTNYSETIIVIEDSDDQWALMSDAFRFSKPSLNLIRLRNKSSMLEFLDKCYKELRPTPQLILLDLYLPNRRDGLSLLESIRYFLSINNLPDIPIIVFSHSPSKKDINACYQRFANAYLVKPTDLSQWPLHLNTLSYVWKKAIRYPISKNN